MNSGIETKTSFELIQEVGGDLTVTHTNPQMYIKLQAHTTLALTIL
jgi:hypothetical protein